MPLPYDSVRIAGLVMIQYTSMSSQFINVNCSHYHKYILQQQQFQYLPISPKLADSSSNWPIISDQHLLPCSTAGNLPPHYSQKCVILALQAFYYHTLRRLHPTSLCNLYNLRSTIMLIFGCPVLRSASVL